MTRVYVNKDYLAYQHEMAEVVRTVVKQKFIGGVKPSYGSEPAWLPADLLPPPVIENLDFDLYEGCADNFILIQTSDDFGIINLVLILKDQDGNLIESGNAFDYPEEPNQWVYGTSVTVAAGTSVTVQAVATDQLGGLSTRSERVTVRSQACHPSTRRNSGGEAVCHDQ